MTAAKTKRKRKKVTKQAVRTIVANRRYEKTALSKQTKERCHYEEVMIDGKPFDMLRADDGLWTLYRRKTITEAEYKGGRVFQHHFMIAGYEAISTTNLTGLGGCGMDMADKMHRTMHSRGYCHRIMDMLGGGDSPMWLAVYWYIGHDKGLRGVAEQMKRDDGSPADSANTISGYVRSALFMIGQDYLSSNENYSGKGFRRPAVMSGKKYT